MTSSFHATREQHLAELKRLLNESAALETMLLDTVAGRRVPASQPARAMARPVAGLKVPATPRRGVRLVIGAAAIAALIAANVAALVHVRSQPQSTHQVAAASSPAPDVAAASWASRALSHDAKIVADPTMHVALAAEHFTNIQAPAVAAAGTSLRFDYIVSTAGLRAMARSGNPIDFALGSSLPIAVFGSGPGQVVVRQVSTTPAADLAARRRADRDTRLTAEGQLLTNPAIRVDGGARAALQAGQLDLRAATVLALMANSSHLEVTSVNSDEPEQAAGLPARSVDVRTDAPDDVQAMLSNLPASYRPITDTLLLNGTHRMVWSIDPEPPPALN